MAGKQTYQGGGDIRLSNMVGGVFDAYTRNKEKEEALARDKADKEAKSQDEFQKSLATVMTGVNTKGLQQVDIPGFQKIYGEMEEQYIIAAQEPDKVKRTLAWAKMKEAASRATLYVSQSEDNGKKRNEQMKILQTQYEKYQADDALKAIEAHYNRPLSEINGDFDILAFRNKWNSADLNKSLDDVKKELNSSLKLTPTETLISSTKNGYDTINTFQISKSIPQADALSAFKSRYNTDENFKRYVDTEFDGNLDSKLTQLYQNLGPSWSTSTTEDRRVAGRAPARESSGGGGSGRSSGSGSASESSSGVNIGVDVAYSGENIATANKQMAFKGNGIKARIGKGVRAYDMDTGEVVNITSNMQDGTVVELLNLPTGDVKGMGRRVLVKGTEGRFEAGRRDEDFAVVRFKEPVYVLKEDDRVTFNGSQAELQAGLKKGTLVKSGRTIERMALFPKDSVMPNPSTMTKSENAALSEYNNTRVTRATPKMSSSVSKILNRK